MKSFNLTEWALGHRALVLFLILVIAVASVFSLTRLGQLEDPKFSVPSMTIMVMWPGAATNVSFRTPPVRVSLPGDPTTSCAIPSAASCPVGSTPPEVPLCRSVATKASLWIAFVSVSRKIRSDNVVLLISLSVL